MALLLLLLRVFVVLSAFFSAVAGSTASCNTAELLSALQPLRSNANYSTCQVDASAAAICVSSACKSLMAPLAALNLPVCQLALKGIEFNTAALRSLSSASCQQQQQTQSQSQHVVDHSSPHALTMKRTEGHRRTSSRLR